MAELQGLNNTALPAPTDPISSMQGLETLMRKYPVWPMGQTIPKEFLPGQGGVASWLQGPVSSLDPLGGIFGGERAATKSPGMLEEARRLMKLLKGTAKKVSEKIRKKTGWFKGLDDKWRFEIDDSKMDLTEGIINHIDSGYMDIGFDAGVKVGDILEHKELFDAYPNIKNIPVKIEYNIWKRPSGGSFSPKGIEVRYKDMDEVKEILTHEIQHGIQEVEGFAKGGSPRSGVLTENQAAKVMDDINYLNRKLKKAVGKPEYNRLMDQKLELVEFYQSNTREGAYERYKSLAGEIEARDVSTRLPMTAQERLSGRPDIDRGDAIVRFEGGGAESAIAETPEQESFFVNPGRFSRFGEDLTTEIIKNPGPQAYGELSREFKKDFPNAFGGDPKIRHTVDSEGNKYIWRADQGTHDMIGPIIDRMFNTKTNQNFTPSDISNDLSFLMEEVDGIMTEYGVENMFA